MYFICVINNLLRTCEAALRTSAIRDRCTELVNIEHSNNNNNDNCIREQRPTLAFQ